MRSIVVGIDDSRHAESLLDWTARFAEEVSTHVTIVHAVPRSEVWTISSAMLDSNKYLRDIRKQFERHGLAALTERGIPTDLRIELGDPAHTLAEIARRTHAELIVVGASHGVVHDLVSGVGHRLERLVDVPVVLVPSTLPAEHEPV